MTQSICIVVIYLSIMYLLKDIKSALEVIKEPLQLEELVRVHRTDRTDRTDLTSLTDTGVYVLGTFLKN